MSKKFLMVLIVLFITILIFNSFSKDEKGADFNPLDFEIGDVFNYIDENEERVILNYVLGDVTGDREDDIIILIGKNSGDSSINSNMDVVTYDIKNNVFVDSDMSKYIGSTPKLYLEDVDGDEILDVIVIASFDDMGQLMRIVSFTDDVSREILKENDAKVLGINGMIIDGFKANIKIKKLKKEIQIDLSDNKENYITSGFYLENGKLKTDRRTVRSAGIYDIDFVDINGKTGIKYIERVKGFDDLDIIDQIEVLMRYENGQWIIIEAKGQRTGDLIGGII